MGIPTTVGLFNKSEFVKFLKKNGAVILKPTNEWEVLRYKAINQSSDTISPKLMTHIIYTKNDSRLTWCGWSDKHYIDFLRGRELGFKSAPSPKQKIDKIKKKTRSKSASVRARLLARDGDLCWFCGKAMPETDQTREHLIPQCVGGSDSLENLVLTHQKCNLKLADKPVPQKIEMRAEERAKK